jgi:hypothetical protein
MTKPAARIAASAVSLLVFSFDFLLGMRTRNRENLGHGAVERAEFIGVFWARICRELSLLFP